MLLLLLWQKIGVIIWIPLLLRCDWYWNSQTIDDIINDKEGDAPAPVIGDKRQHADDDDEDGKTALLGRVLNNTNNNNDILYA